MNILLSVSHGLIAIVHLLITVYFWRKLILPARDLRRGWRAVAAAIILTFFAFGATRTNLRVMVAAWMDRLPPSWYDFPSVTFTLLQAIAGVLFIVFSARWVRVSLFDKRYFNDIIHGEDTNGR